MIRAKFSVAHFLVAVVLVAIPCSGQQPVRAVRFDHSDPKDRFRHVKARPGEEILVTIANTAGDAVFTYSIDPIPVTLSFPAPAAIPTYAAVDKQLTQTHSSRYGGYVVNARAKVTGTIQVKLGDGSQKALTDTQFVIAVDPTGWDYELSGAFTVGFKLEDPKFAIEEIPKEGTIETQKIIVRDRSAEDEFRLGVGAMIHAFHQEHVPWLAGTFGIAINDGNRASYFVGPTLRLNSKAAFTAGASFTSVSRLPTGVNENDPVTDDNVLNNLGTKVVNGWFFAFSYTFLNPGLEAFKKPFKGE